MKRGKKNKKNFLTHNVAAFWWIDVGRFLEIITSGIEGTIVDLKKEKGGGTSPV